MKKITAYFSDGAKARAAAFDLSESCAECGDVLVGSVSAEDAHITNYVFIGLFLGAAAGLILGYAAKAIPSLAAFSEIGTVAGLVAGSVIGAVAGSIIDILGMESNPQYSLVTLCVQNENGGRISGNLKKRGAAYVVVEKDVNQDEKRR